MDAFIDAFGALCLRLLPVLGAMVLVGLFIVLIKIIKVLNNLNLTVDKIQGPVDTVVKVSKTADETCDKIIESRDKLINKAVEGADLIVEKLKTNNKN